MTDDEIGRPPLLVCQAVDDGKGQGHAPEGEGKHVYEQQDSTHRLLPVLLVQTKLLLIVGQVRQSADLGDVIEHCNDIGWRQAQLSCNQRVVGAGIDGSLRLG